MTAHHAALGLTLALVLAGGVSACGAPAAQACLDGSVAAGLPGEPSPPPPAGTVSLREAADPLLREVDAHPAVFGGAFLNRTHTVVCVLHSAPVGPARALLAPHAAGLPVAWVAVPYSMSQLQATQDAVVDRWRAGEIAGLNYVSIDVAMNRVVVSLEPGKEALGEQIGEDYGQMVVVRIEAPGPSI